MDMNQWFQSLPAERQAILRDDKWMLANAAFEAAQQAAASTIRDLQEQVMLLEKNEPTASDVDMLRKALTNAGISAPESNETLAHEWRSHLRHLLRSVAFLNEFRLQVATEFSQSLLGVTVDPATLKTKLELYKTINKNKD